MERASSAPERSVIITRSGSTDITGHLDQSAERYYYTADNKRVSTARPNGNAGQAQVFYVYGAKGEIAAICTSYVFGDAPTCDPREPRDVKFAGRMIIQNYLPVAVDRLGSVVANPTQGSYGSALPKYYGPYGEQCNEGQSGVGFPGNTNFATYFHDETTGLNYADQRFYNATYGRFMNADPYRASAGPEDPGSWNKYSYVDNDPVNLIDPTGEFAWAGNLKPLYNLLLTNNYNNMSTARDYAALVPDHIENTQDQNEFWAKSQTATFRSQLGQAIQGLSEHCVSELSSTKDDAGTSVLEHLVRGTGSINFGSTSSGASSLQLGNSLLAGTSVSQELGTQTAAEYFETMTSLGIQAGAFTLGNFVLLNSESFYRKNSSEQGITLLHEAFHATGLGNDVAVATLLRLPGASTIYSASTVITAYLRNDCYRF